MNKGHPAMSNPAAAGLSRRTVTTGRRRVLVRGSNDVASAVAHRLFSAGHAVVLVDGPAPAATRRRMAFADAVFAGRAVLAGVVAERVDRPEPVLGHLTAHAFIPVVVGDLAGLLPALVPEVLVDARMRKRDQPEPQRGLAPLTVGLGPGFVAGETVDIAVETSWDGLGGIVRHGATRSLAGEPRPLAGHGRDRSVYAPLGGLFRTQPEIGQAVAEGEVVARIEGVDCEPPSAGCSAG
jgi:xanthine dehydrogenase accessory factor